MASHVQLQTSGHKRDTPNHFGRYGGVQPVMAGSPMEIGRKSSSRTLAVSTVSSAGGHSYSTTEPHFGIIWATVKIAYPSNASLHSHENKQPLVEPSWIG